MADTTVARYAVHSAKVLESIVWLAHESPGIDIYHLVKAAYFADKIHLNAYGRPIAGDDYMAATYGPLGRCIYQIIKADPIAMLALGGNGPLPFKVDSQYRVTAQREANAGLLSRSDVEALRHGLDEAKSRNFNELVELTHAEPAYLRAAGGRMRYEDMLDLDDKDHDEKAADLAETARFAVF